MFALILFLVRDASENNQTADNVALSVAQVKYNIQRYK